MKMIYNNVIPFRGFKCVNLFGVLFVRRDCTMCEADYTHEAIHTAQMKEMLFVFFYLAYVAEWLYHLCRCGNAKVAYFHISFECEAYKKQNDTGYLERRRHYAQYKKRRNRLWH